MRSRHRAREIALQTLYAMDFNNELGTVPVPEVFPALTEEEQSALEQEVVIFAKYIVCGTIEHLPEIDAMIARFSTNRPIERIDVVDRNILRLSVFSLLYSKDIHPHIVIDEAVKLSQDFSSEVNYKFINGILDSMQKSLQRGGDVQ
ncbi:MAG: transcription antitermination factor NusB [Sphaerochaetaceae bacterium]|nr:transcription antitermination factor NusB [Sphaerochaetaceae bacterium]